MYRNYEHSDNFDTESTQKLLDEILSLVRKLRQLTMVAGIFIKSKPELGCYNHHHQ